MEKRIGIYTCILPRLEVFFLNEWIQHHLNLGVEHVYIYDNGHISIDNSEWAYNPDAPKIDNPRVWAKKPTCDYYLQYSDTEINEILMSIIASYDDYVTLIPWYYNIHHKLTHPDQQLQGYINCVNENQHIDWWLHIDPDEYIMLYKHDVIADLIYPGTNCYKISQRVFDLRSRGTMTRKIFNYGYDHIVPKALISKHIKTYNIHHPEPSKGKTSVVSPKIARVYHYRGHPTGKGTDHNTRKLRKIERSGKSITFNRVDKSMNKYLL